MRTSKWAGIAAAGILLTGALVTRAQDGVLIVPEEPNPGYGEPNCPFFDSVRSTTSNSKTVNSTPSPGDLAAATMMVAAKLGYRPSDTLHPELAPIPGGSRTDGLDHPSNTIDKYIFPALVQAGVAPAPPTTDYEFVRRIYLDLTGRIPTAQQVTSFVNDTTANKRATLIDSLIGSSNWVDKWVIWFGDLYQNNSRNAQIPRYMPGVMAFNDYVRSSLQANKPYNVMAQELVANAGSNTFTQGELNFTVGGVISNGPDQDTFDQQAVNAFTAFLGISHLNCLLCHTGRGHLDALSLWGYYTTRQQAWGVSAFMAHTGVSRTPVANAVNNQPYYWGVNDAYKPAGSKVQTDYQLNTTTGNRPARTGSTPTATVPPSYIFTGAGPNPGESYRAALGRLITNDFQFARATVNYQWEYFFGIGLVSPSNQMDPLRLDPTNPPQNCPGITPCVLQASNPGLLNALAQDFVASGYDIRALQREIVNSQAYQLSSRYNGTWNALQANLFSRKLVRRLWSEEVHDSVATSSGVIPTYSGNFGAIGNYTTWGPQSFAMKFPEPSATPDGSTGAVSMFLDAFLRGNRDDQTRSGEPSISQALGLMNDNFVMSRVQATKTSGSLISNVLQMSNDQAVNTLFLTILSRPPSSTEYSLAMANIGVATRTQDIQNLMWELYNKVDFAFNY